MKVNLPGGWKLELKRTPSMDVRKNPDASFDKVFFIGLNKTATTTMYHTAQMLGFKVANQTVGEVLSVDWMEEGRFDRLENYIATAEVFQDVPFSLPGFYKELSARYPKAKFVLTLRDTPEQWFNSTVKFHQKQMAKGTFGAELPEDVLYLYKGWAATFAKYAFQYPEVPQKDKNHYIAVYNQHHADVLAHFNSQPERLLVLNAAEQGALHQLLDFLEISYDSAKTPANFAQYKKT